MKKSLLLALCLSVSMLAQTEVNVASANTTEKNVVCVQNVEDDDNTNPETTKEIRRNSDANGVAEISVSSAGDLKAFVMNDYTFTDNFKNATRVNIIGTGVTLSDDDLGAISSFAKLKLLDLSGVAQCDYSKIALRKENNNDVKISLIILGAENTTGADGTVVYADQVAHLRTLADANKFNSVYSFHENEGRTMSCFALLLTTTDMGYLSTVPSEKKAKNLVVVTNTGDYTFNQVSTFSAVVTQINKVTGVDNLVLSNMANCTAVDVSGLSNSGLKRLILPDNYSKTALDQLTFSAGCGIKVVQCLKQAAYPNADKNNFISYVKEAGGLAAIKDSHYYQTNFSEARSVVFYGNINEDDFEFFNGVKNSRLNLSRLTHTTKGSDGTVSTINLTNAISKLSNQYVEYIALPDGVNYPADTKFSNLFGNENLPKLKAVGVLVTETAGEGEETTTKTSLVINSSEKLGIYNVEEMENLKLTTNEASRLASVNKYTLSGLAHPQDLLNGAYYVDKNGHVVVSITTTAGTSRGEMSYTQYCADAATLGYTQVTGIADYKNATEYDFSGLRLWDEAHPITDAAEQAAAQNDFAFAKYINANVTSIELPTDESVYRLPNSGLQNLQKLRQICIPSNYKEIGMQALQNCNSMTLCYTKYVDGEGTAKYVIDGQTLDALPADLTAYDKSCTLPVNLERVEFAAFANQYQYDDVYVQTYTGADGLQHAPYCSLDAFDNRSLYGSGGFDGVHPIQRTNYKNSSASFAVLHFPSGISKSLTMKYTDIDRVYTYTDETGATDGNGNIIQWPTQDEWYRSYKQAITGYTWKDWTAYEATTYEGGMTTYQLLGGNDGTTITTMTRDNVNTSKNSYGKSIEDILVNKTYTGEGATVNDFAPSNTDWTTGSTTESFLEVDDTWMGWHQFVLVAAYNYTNNGENEWTVHTSDDDWWTLCLPFDMTKEEIEINWGVGTKLCTLTGVTRNETDGTITLEFGADLMTDRGESDVVITKRMPYMMKPSFKDIARGEDYNGPKFTLTEEQNNQLAANTANFTAGFTFGTDGHNDCYVEVTAEDANGQTLKDGDHDYNYVFFATPTKYYIPTYGYFLGWDVAAQKVNYFYQGVEPTRTANYMQWNAYTCVVGHALSSQIKWVVPAAGATTTSAHYEFAVTSDAKAMGNDDLASWNKSDSKVNMIFDADGTTAISGTLEEGRIVTAPKDARVYTLSGQVVRSTPSLDGLVKGVYVIGGKKYVK